MNSLRKQSRETDKDFLYRFDDPKMALAEAERRILIARSMRATELDLTGLGLTELPESLHKLVNLKVLYLHRNKLGLPIEILGPDWLEAFLWNGRNENAANILDYYYRTRAGARPLNEAKLILLGRGEVGKTCLVNRLVYDRFASTDMRESGIQ
jgi:internalin A